MNINDFKRIVVSFADSASDIEILKNGRINVIIRGELLTADLVVKEGELYVLETGIEMSAVKWISIRLAQLEQLADRIREYINPVSDFINPTGMLLDDVDIDPSEVEKPTDNVTTCLQLKLGRNTPGATDVVYLTSDAGEGKTTIINHLALQQANLFKTKNTTWLLVPIPLGGRPFLRFDDIVIASLVNRLRFRSFYYESFLELVKLGLIVPAFDGFEEMFMESSSGEALSATAQLITRLESHGNVLIAARKAYFDYKSFNSQAKLFDSIGSNSVSFSKISINRWSKEQFIEYGISRNIVDIEKIYDLVAGRLKDNNHPLLTRPVLVNRLLSVVPSEKDIINISSALESSTTYFPNFVEAIIKREAEYKWIDTSGEPFKPLLTVGEHYELLAAIAEEMWTTNTNSLDISVIDLIADLYCELKSFSVRTSRQIKERLKQHALLIRSVHNSNHLQFDHEEFQEFFLGLAFFNALKDKKVPEFKNLMRKGLIFTQTIEAITVYCKKDKPNLREVVELMNIIQYNEGPTSFVRENCGSLILKILSSEDASQVILDGYSFPANGLESIRLRNLVVRNSHFQITSIISSYLENCLFQKCSFDGIELEHESSTIEKVILKDCEVSAVQNKSKDLSYYDPFSIKNELVSIGFAYEITENTAAITNSAHETYLDNDLEIVQKALRRFVRGSHINDNVFKLKLGPKAPYFLEELLPILLEVNILAEIEYSGQGQKRRFKLATPFENISKALKESKGSFESFITILKRMNNYAQ